ncbi:MAG: hypothetical protein RR585_05820 [Coprobacillus sp.]
MITKNRIFVAGIVIILIILCTFLKGSLTTNTVSNTYNGSTNQQNPSTQNQEQNTSEIYIEC